MLATDNQRKYIANFIYRNYNEYEYLGNIWKDTPRNNAQHSDIRCDYTQIILADRLKKLTQKQADYIIKAWAGEYGYKTITARNIIINNII